MTVFHTSLKVYFYGALWVVIFDVTIALFWSSRKCTQIRQNASLISVFVFWVLHWESIPLSLYLSMGLPNIEIRLFSNPTMGSKCSSGRKSCMPLSLNQKLERVNLSEEGMSKAEIGTKQLAKLWMQSKSLWRMLKLVLQPWPSDFNLYTTRLKVNLWSRHKQGGRFDHWPGT